MCTDYRFLKRIPYLSLFDGRLAKFGVTEHIDKSNETNFRCLTNGSNYLWISGNGKGGIGRITGPMPSNPNPILTAIRHAFDAELCSKLKFKFCECRTQRERGVALREPTPSDDDLF